MKCVLKIFICVTLISVCVIAGTGMSTAMTTAEAWGGSAVSEAGAEVIVPTAVTGLVYNGESQKLIHEGKTDDGTFMYCLVSADEAEHFEAEKVEWTDKIPEATDASKEYVARIIHGCLILTDLHPKINDNNV